MVRIKVMTFFLLGGMFSDRRVPSLPFEVESPLLESGTTFSSSDDKAAAVASVPKEKLCLLERDDDLAVEARRHFCGHPDDD